MTPEKPEANTKQNPARVAVLLPLPLSGAYDYAVPTGMDAKPGDFVAVPLGKRVMAGVVWDIGADADVAAEKLRPIEGFLDTPPMPLELRRFVDWVAAYTMTPPGAVLRMAMSVSAALLPPAPATALRLADQLPEGLRITPPRRRVLDLLADGRSWLAGDLALEAGVSSAVIRGLADLGALVPVILPEFGAMEPNPAREPAELSGDQRDVAETLAQLVHQGGFSVSLLDGVTGAGKTEVYFAAIEAALAQGKRCLVLLPEIALSGQWLDRFRQRFGASAVLWHSELRGSERVRSWRRIARGLAPVVVGARSALFLPLGDLGLIVVDEEHEASFKQEDGVLYHARDMAVVRAQIAAAPIVLVSATPSLETLTNAEQGRYRPLHLPDRHAGAALPSVSAIDIRKTPPARGSWISPPLRAALAETLEKGDQAMLFLNRRGYAPLTLCRACGHRMQCPNCTAWLVEHRLLGRLICHHCGYGRKIPQTCPQCEATDSLIACGPGVERLAEEAAALFPDIRQAVMASDQLHGAEAAAEMIRRMAAHEIDLLIGTQMIAKGHHFPGLTLVGVVDADLGLGGGDLRAGERTYQLLHQVAGRAGRAERPGRVMLQTAMPDHPVIAALVAGDRDRFIAAESAEREAHGMPPFGRLAALIVSSPSADLAQRTARALARSAPRVDGLTVLGPAPAPLALLRGRHRYRLLVKARRDLALQKYLRHWLEATDIPNAVRVIIDIDPQSFL